MSFPQPEDIEEEEDSDDAENPEGDDEDAAPTELLPVDTNVEAEPPPDDEIPMGSSGAIAISGDAAQDGEQAVGISAQENHSTSPGRDTFTTARSQPKQSSPEVTASERSDERLKPGSMARVSAEQNGDSARISTQSSPGDFPEGASSKASLIPHRANDAQSAGFQGGIREQAPRPLQENDQETGESPHHLARKPTNLVRFSVEDNVAKKQDRVRRKVSNLQERASSARLRRQTLRKGEIVKMERMLVRIDVTAQQLEQDYDENDSMKTETRMVEKWREYMVVCRQSNDNDTDLRLQLYKTRVIPAIEDGSVKKKCAHEIRLSAKFARVNMFSSLDKTVVIWHPYKKSTRIYIMKPRSTSHSVEWYTFLRDILGWKRPSTLQVNVPDLSVNLRIEKPFEQLEASRNAISSSDEAEAALAKTMEEEQAVAGRIIQKCIEMLEGDPEWSNVLEAWSRTEKMGLAWKRYDRLEWVHGANEQKMYGTIAMQKSHELELRPKQHYPTSTHGKKGNMHEEPVPIEGFLVRLTSQKGLHQKMGKMFFKRLYFTTQNQYLCFCRPARATPPHPPRLHTISGSNIPSASEIIQKTPQTFDVEPYSLKDGEISWLKSGNRDLISDHDLSAYEESQRNIQNLTAADGFINLTRVVSVRKIHRGATPVDDQLEEGPDVEFHQDVENTMHEDGATKELDDDRTFEIVLNNGLIIRLQAYSEEMQKLWIRRLRALVNYWKLRNTADMDLFKMVRRTNLERLNIDEEMEAMIGQFARKWEVSKSEASPQLYNMCGIACCRTITISGQLYRKARRRATFIRCGVILCNGQLLIYQGTLRSRTGKAVPHIHQERQTTLELRDCYIYSGLITESDLLYTNQTFDSNHPGVHALPRVYLEDGWTSSDEDTMTCFVIWHGLKKSFFRANEDQEEGGTRSRIRQVSTLGVPGRTIVFKCRSRAERDHWVMSIGMEIDRLQQSEDFRLTHEK